MKVNSLDSSVLKEIVHDVIGNTASQMLLNNIYGIIDQQHKDAEAQKQACDRIQRMVSLFIGPEVGQVLGQRFQTKFN